MSTEIGKAYVQIMPSAKGIGKNIESIMNSEGGDGGSVGGSWGSVFAGAAGAAIRAAGGAVVSGAKAVGRLASEAISSYADYEQLVGGIETLFQGSSDTMLTYAQQAYQTAGMSANQYMETATAFSASLLQSMGGDTAAAADRANMAITDMADNANKMGTSIESLQDAYRGFSRGNFTMLDNLALGYGGTRSEMERLLLDAEAVKASQGEMVSYSIDSYSDMVEAIHVVQDEMGITGTTSLEASSTISGSMSSMKAAWGNLLTSFAGGGDEIGVALDGFMESIMTVADNLIPVIEQMLPNIVVGLSTLITGLGEQLPGLISTLLPQLISSALSLAGNLMSILPEVAVSVLTSFITGITDSIPTLVPLVFEIIPAMCGTILEGVPSIISSAIELIGALGQGVLAALPGFVAQLPQIIMNFCNFIANNLPTIVAQGIQMIGQLAIGLVQAIPQLVAKLPLIIAAIVRGLANIATSMLSVGLDVVRGIWSGISNGLTWIKNKIREWVGNVLSFIKGLFGIHSPSKVMRDEVGIYLAQGIGVGFSDEMKNVRADMRAAMPTSFDFAGSYAFAGEYGAAVADSGDGNIVGQMVAAFEQMEFKVKGREFGRLVRGVR